MLLFSSQASAAVGADIVRGRDSYSSSWLRRRLLPLVRAMLSCKRAEGRGAQEEG